MGSPTEIERMFIPGPAGPLEALLEWAPATAPAAAALLCHPHPQYGGNMHNKVVHRAAKAALGSGLPALRFNFRGAGGSAGSFDNGAGEQEDARAALDYLVSRFPRLPVCLIGFSFGAWVGLAVGASDPHVAALAGLGVPAGVLDFSFLRGVQKPKLFVQGTRDQFGPPAEVAALFQSLAAPKQIHWVEGGDHFFTGKLDELENVLCRFMALHLISPFQGW